jgi:hypothetical protein
MKRGFFTLLLVVVVAVGVYGISYWCAIAPARDMLARSGGEMEWLRHEYHLNDAQFARIEQLHREYTPKCDRMCEKIMKADVRLDEIIGANASVTPEVEAALKESAAVQEECRQAMLGHIYAVSAEMSREDGARYLQMMKTRIIEPALGHETAISKSSK